MSDTTGFVPPLTAPRQGCKQPVLTEHRYPKEISCNLDRANNPAGIPPGCPNQGEVYRWCRCRSTDRLQAGMPPASSNMPPASSNMPPASSNNPLHSIEKPTHASCAGWSRGDCCNSGWAMVLSNVHSGSCDGHQPGFPRQAQRRLAFAAMDERPCHMPLTNKLTGCSGTPKSPRWSWLIS